MLWLLQVSVPFLIQAGPITNSPALRSLKVALARLGVHALGRHFAEMKSAGGAKIGNRPFQHSGLACRQRADVYHAQAGGVINSLPDHLSDDRATLAQGAVEQVELYPIA